MQQSISTFKYHELQGSAKDKARQHYIEHWIHEDWYDYIFEDAKEGGKELGFLIEDISFSGFWSQGDGAMWVGDVYLPDFIKHNLPDSIGRDCWLWLLEDKCINDYARVRRTGHHYSHSNCMGLDNIYAYDHEPDDLVQYDCILKGAPIDTVWNLILADKACPIHSLDDLEELVLTEARNYADRLYKTLQSGYEAECDEDQVSECYDANNVLFNEEGVIV